MVRLVARLTVRFYTVHVWCVQGNALTDADLQAIWDRYVRLTVCSCGVWACRALC